MACEATNDPRSLAVKISPATNVLNPTLPP
jgi:hypothetical protein